MEIREEFEMEIVIQEKFRDDETITLEQMLQNCNKAVEVYEYNPTNKKKRKIKEEILTKYFEQLTAKQLLGFIELCKSYTGNKYREIIYDIGKFYI